MADTQETRRLNLRRLVTEHEGMTKLAARLGLKAPAYISQLLADPPYREITEKTARKWEKVLGLPEGHMDGPPRAYGAARAEPLNAALLAQTIEVVTEALAAAKVMLTPAKLGELVAMQYGDALATGKVDAARVQTIVSLIKR